MGNCMNSKNQNINSQDKGDSNMLKTKQKQGAKELKQNYNIDSGTQVLGSGAFGKVFLTFNKHNKEHQVAIKVMNKSKLKDHLDAIQEEVGILTKLDHPNIVKYYETYVDEKYIYLVMEYIDGGELFEKIAQQENQVFSEQIAKTFMMKLFSALNHMHAQGVVHRDIKPENIMLTKSDELKLIDFGLSKRQQGNKKLKTIAGTPYYMAPEVLDGQYDSKCDTWSLGVLLYVFMSGYLPFQGDNRNEVFSKIQQAKFHFNHNEFQACSPGVIELIKALLVVDPKKRLSAGQALQHPWFKSEIPNAQRVNENVLMRLQSFRGVSKLKKAAMNMLVKMADQAKIEGLREQFQNIDKDQTGLISADELRRAIQQSNIDIPESKINEIIEEVDYFGNKKINYTEFLVATLDVKAFLDDAKLQALFSQFDTDNSGKITKENIVTAMSKIGHDITQLELDEIMAQHDLEKNDVITFYEFKALLLDLDNVGEAENFQLKESKYQ